MPNPVIAGKKYINKGTPMTSIMSVLEDFSEFLSLKTLLIFPLYSFRQILSMDDPKLYSFFALLRVIILTLYPLSDKRSAKFIVTLSAPPCAKEFKTKVI